MKKIRISAVICALVMVLGAAAPVSEGAFSADNLVVASAENAAFEGCCGKTDENDGKNVTWLLDADGTLTISGTGEMNDFFYDRSVWIGDERIKMSLSKNG
ncbi:MAG: hypothetical protein K6B74_07310 [Ruminococcus sp.]|nr:hypothetical protein [Ruminococcus sp.]